MTEFGISLLPDASPDELPPATYFANALAVASLTEELGLEYVKMTEHYMRPYGGFCPDPLAYLSAVAATTRNVRLMTGGIQASFHHPVEIAAKTAQLDALSGGRLEVGFARAFLPYEFDTFGIDMDGSHERFRETVQAVVRLWSEPNVSEDGKFFRYDGVTSFPPPTQHPHPPVWGAALLTRSSFEWLGDSGFNLLIASAPSREKVTQLREMIDVYRERFQAAPGNAGRRPRVAISIALFLAESDAVAQEEGIPALRRHWEAFSDASQSWQDRKSSSYEGYREALTEKHSTSTPEDAGLAVIGSPSTAARQVREICAELTPDIVLWQVDFGHLPLAPMQRSLQLFASQVRPLLGEGK
jgi:alkanesulfonate monooxygenase SsuD/methylene tetrahydromethanopterin reductase-like flavin-dependent oxidoreductase (luciferase family)